MASPLDDAIIAAPDIAGTAIKSFAALAEQNERHRSNDLRLQELRNQYLERQASLGIRTAAAAAQAPLIAARVEQATAMTELARVRAATAPVESEAKVANAKALALKRTTDLNRQKEADNQLADFRGKMLMTQDANGVSLDQRLHSMDQKVADAAAQEAYKIMQEYRTSPFKAVKDAVTEYEKIPVITAKVQLARDQQALREQAEKAKTEARGDRIKQADTRIGLQGKAVAETARHNQVTEGISQQNANTSASKAGAAGSNGLTLTVPSLGKLSMNTIRKTLAKGQEPTATEQEKSDADALRRGILSIPSGQKDQETGNMIPRYTSGDLAKWASEASADETPATVEPSAPITPAAAAPAATPVPAKSTRAVDRILEQSGIKKPSASIDSGSEVEDVADAVPFSSLPSIAGIPSVYQIPGLIPGRPAATGMASLAV